MCVLIHVHENTYYLVWQDVSSFVLDPVAVAIYYMLIAALPFDISGAAGLFSTSNLHLCCR